jgi:hypothetical protein
MNKLSKKTGAQAAPCTRQLESGKMATMAPEVDIETTIMMS